MPIAKDRTVIVTQDDLPVNVASPEYKGVTVDTYKQQLSSILIYVEGSQWITEYYSQVLNENNELNPLQPKLPAPYQQYIKIKELELKVTDPLTHNQNQENNEMEVVGTANVPAGVIPNVGDMFLADIGDGKEGVFAVTASDKKTMFTSAVYVIEYRLVNPNGTQKRLELENKVVKTVYYRKDFVTFGQDPIIIEPEVLNIEKLTTHLNNIKDYYFSRFYSNEYSTLIVPNQGASVYDPFLVKTMQAMFNVDEHPVLQKIRHLNIEGDQALKQDTLWTALLNVNKTYLLNAVTKIWLVSTRYWSGYPLLKTIRFSGIEYVAYPNNPLTTVNNQFCLGPEVVGIQFSDSSRIDSNGDVIPWVDPTPTPPPVVVGEWDASNDTFPTLGTGPSNTIAPYDTWLISDAGSPGGLALAENQFIQAVVAAPGQDASNWIIYDMSTPIIPPNPLIRPVTLDDYYVLSEAFYTNNGPLQSVLEVQLTNMFSDEAISISELYRLCDDYLNWGLLEQFYYTPLLLTMIKHVIRKM